MLRKLPAFDGRRFAPPGVGGNNNIVFAEESDFVRLLFPKVLFPGGARCVPAPCPAPRAGMSTRRARAAARRPDGRAVDELRTVALTRAYTCHAEGSVLVEFGRTRVLCTASLQDGVPGFLRGQGRGWLTAEYGMLPRSTVTRVRRESAGAARPGRSVEIQRLIGRALRSAVDLKKLGESTLILDCDVLQADGGTRTAAITGACVALADALRARQGGGGAPALLRNLVAAVSVGLCQGRAVLDMDYAEDQQADTDMNVVMNSEGRYIELQASAEGRSFTAQELHEMLDLAQHGLRALLARQQEVLGADSPAMSDASGAGQ